MLAKRKEKEPKTPKERPDINKFVDQAIMKINDLVTDLFKIVGNTQYIGRLTKDTFKSNLDVLYGKIEELRKEL